MEASNFRCLCSFSEKPTTEKVGKGEARCVDATRTRRKVREAKTKEDEDGGSLDGRVVRRGRGQRTKGFLV